MTAALAVYFDTYSGQRGVRPSVAVLLDLPGRHYVYRESMP